MPEPGLIAVPCLELVYAAFASTLARLALTLPAGSTVVFDPGSTTIGNKRDALARFVLKDPQLRWVLFIDSDQQIPPRTLDRLLSHGVPIVGALIVKKIAGAVAAVRTLADDYVPRDVPHIQATTRDGSFSGFSDGRQNGRIRLGAGLQPVEGVGTGCLLVRREVFEALPDPWFVTDEVGPNAGMNEDFNFCDRARAAGFPVYVDTDLIVPHLTVVPMTPAVAAALPQDVFRPEGLSSPGQPS